MWEELTKIEICENIWCVIEILCLGYPSPMEKVENRNMTPNMFWWMLKIIFWLTTFYIGNIVYLAKIVRALSSNKIVFLHFCKKVYDVWFSEDDNTGFLSVGLDIFGRLYLKEQPISFPMVLMSTINTKYGK